MTVHDGRSYILALNHHGAVSIAMEYEHGSTPATVTLRGARATADPVARRETRPDRIGIVADVTWEQLSATQQAVLAEAADDLEVELWELVAPVKVIFLGGDRSLVTEPADVDVVRAAIRFLRSHGLIALGRRAGDGSLVAVPDDALDDPRTWEPHAGRGLLVYATEAGDGLYDEVLPRPKGA